MAEIELSGTIAKEKSLAGSINKGIGMGELPQARGLSEFLSPAYSVNGADLTAVGEAIAAKSGVEKPVFPDGFVGGVEVMGDTLEDIESLTGGEAPLKNQLQADIAAANAATGKEDATMHDAVNSLIEGFGGVSGGLPSGVVTCTAGHITPSSDMVELIFEHGLGVIPDVIFGYAEIEFPPTQAEIVTFLYAPYPYRVSASETREKSFVLGYATLDYMGVGTYAAAGSSSEINENTVKFYRGSSVYKFRAGRTYRWFAVKIAEV